MKVFFNDIVLGHTTKEQKLLNGSYKDVLFKVFFNRGTQADKALKDKEPFFSFFPEYLILYEHPPLPCLLIKVKKKYLF